MKNSFIAKRLYFLILGCLGILTFFSCKTTQETTKSHGISTVELETVHAKQVHFTYLSSKVNLEYDGFSVQGQLRMKYDSILWLSLSKFGFEIARVKATNDSLLFLNKFQNEYFAGDYSFIKKKIGFDLNYNFLQALFLGNDFSCFENDNNTVNTSEEAIVIEFRNRAQNPNCVLDKKLPNIAQVMLVSPKNQRIMQNNVQIIGRPAKLTANYADFKSVGTQTMAMELTFSIESMAGNFNAAVSFSNPVFDKEQTFPFSIPSKSTSIEF